MNVAIYCMECVVLTVIFNLCIFLPLCKNPEWWIHDYPKDIQEEYFKTHERIPTSNFSKPAMLKRGTFLVVVLFLMVLLAKLAGTHDFITGFGYSYGIWLIINWYDCFIMDWIMFSNIKKVRLPGTEHMDKAYHQKKYHFVQAMKGMVLGAVPCLIVGVIMMF